MERRVSGAWAGNAQRKLQRIALISCKARNQMSLSASSSRLFSFTHLTFDSLGPPQGEARRKDCVLFGMQISYRIVFWGLLMCTGIPLTAVHIKIPKTLSCTRYDGSGLSDHATVLLFSHSPIFLRIPVYLVIYDSG